MRLIDADDVCNVCIEECLLADCDRCVLKEFKLHKVIDSASLHIRAKWIPCFEDWRKQIEGDECSACGFQHYGTSIANYNFCPNCGADMRGAADI